MSGQSQGGIDVYARTSPKLGGSRAVERTYVALQSRRVKRLSPSSIASAVDDFLDGEWVDRCATFYYATSHALRSVTIDAAIREAEARLSARGVKLVPWGQEQVSELLRDQPRLVDDFFGRSWVGEFCGADALERLRRRIPPEQARAARTALGNLYRAAFSSLGASATVTGAHSGGLSFVLLDTKPLAERSHAFFESPEERDRRVSQGAPDYSPAEPEQEFARSSRLSRRFTPRPARKMQKRPTEEGGPRTPVDEWAQTEKRRLLIGAPGSGKSSFLMFAAMDILASSPQSAALQRSHGGDLPLWLPFGFLCRHLEGSTTNSVVSALEAWVSQQGGGSSWSLAQLALDDERALLLVDGIDEWSDAPSAEYALGLIESFVSQREIGAILTARPFALEKLNWVTPWEKAMLAPLTDAQQLDLVHRALTESESFGVEGAAASHAGTFLAELGRVPALNPLLRTPLFLSVLARTWRGESLPPHRFRMFSAIVQLLVERHPQMRRRASTAAGSEFSTAEMLAVLRGVAYQSRVDGGSSIASRLDMERRFRSELRRAEGLAYPANEAARVATAVLAQAEDEYGLLVPQGIGMVGFLHRVLLDQLAGEHLATLDPAVFESNLRSRASDPSWRDALLAGLSAQVNAYINTSLLTKLMEDPAVAATDKYELIASAIAADVAITPSKQALWVAEITERVADHPDSDHRIALINALVGSTIHAALRPVLLGTFERWLSASHPEPASAIWMLRDNDVAEDGVLPVLMWGLGHDDEDVQLNAAHAIAVRYAGNSVVAASVEERVRIGGSANDQAYALLSLGTGWPDWAALPELIGWAREQVVPELRVCALHLLDESREPGAPAVDLSEVEVAWFEEMLRLEGGRPAGHWRDLAVPFVQEVLSKRPTAATFVLETLANNGSNGGDRSLAWLLACTTFSDDVAVKDWVADELAHPERRGLILHNLALIPDVWRADPAFAERVVPTIREEATSPSPTLSAGAISLSAVVPDDVALDVLLAGLDDYRPARVGRALLERFREHPRVREAFDQRLHASESAPALASLACDALGDEQGFEILVGLLRAQATDHHDGEPKVLVAMAVADAWIDFNARREDPSVAALIAAYDADELATLCSAVGTRSLTWHVGSVIAAWPDHPAVIEFAQRALMHPRNNFSGIHDPVPPAIIRTYGSRVNDTASKMMDSALSQLGYLPPELREALVEALTRSDLSPSALIDLLRNWKDDPDAWVQRAVVVGLIGRVDRYLISSSAEPSRADSSREWLAEQIREQLCAYGPIHDEQRQTAWMGMLLLGDLRLHDDLTESIGEPTRPGVQLYHPFGGADQELIELVSANWKTLVAHFGPEVFQVLGSTRRGESDANTARQTVLRHLSRAQHAHPDLDELIRTEASSDSSFRESREYLLWAHRSGQRDLDLFLALTDKVNHRPTEGRADEVYELLLRATDWDVTDDELLAALRNRLSSRRDLALRALVCELFPEDAVSHELYAELESWFTTRDSVHREWFDTLAIAISCSPAPVLPLIAERAYNLLIERDSVPLLPLLTGPFVRRVRRDSSASKVIQSIVLQPEATNHASTPIWAPQHSTVPPAGAAASARRVFLFASVLRRAGRLDEETAAAADLTLSAVPHTVVKDPFTGVERTLYASIGTLASSRIRAS